MQQRRCYPADDTSGVHSRHQRAGLLQREPHRWLQPVDDSEREWLVKNVHINELHNGSELGLSSGTEGRRR